MRIINLRRYNDMLTEACQRYEKTAPTVEAHCDDLYRRIAEKPTTVTLAELLSVEALWDLGWLQPNTAANHIYHLRTRLGMDTTGHAGF